MAQQLSAGGAGGERVTSGGGKAGGGPGGAGAGAGGPPLVEWSPVYSNYFAYSSGKEGNGIDLYRVSRSVPGEAELLGARGSITDRRPSGVDPQLQLQQQGGEGLRSEVSRACFVFFFLQTRTWYEYVIQYVFTGMHSC